MVLSLLCLCGGGKRENIDNILKEYLLPMKYVKSLREQNMTIYKS